MDEKEMSKIITDLHQDVNDMFSAWDSGKLKSIEAIITIKNMLKYLISIFIKT